MDSHYLRIFSKMNVKKLETKTTITTTNDTLHHCKSLKKYTIQGKWWDKYTIISSKVEKRD